MLKFKEESVMKQFSYYRNAHLFIRIDWFKKLGINKIGFTYPKQFTVIWWIKYLEKV